METGVLDFIFFDLSYFMSFCTRAYENPEFIEKVMGRKFDMVVISVVYGQCFYGLAVKNEAPLVLLASYPLPNAVLKDLGSFGPPSILPYPLLNLGDQMSFPERTLSFLADWIHFFIHEVIDVPLAEAVYRNELGMDYPGIREIHRNASLVLVGTHPLLTHMRPFMPDVVEVGGLHCRPPQALPKVIDERKVGLSRVFFD
jgi:glucuronosyltransferase